MAWRKRMQVEGAKELQGELRALPKELRKEIMDALNQLSPKLVSTMQAKAPKQTGALRTGITFDAYPATLRIEVGLLTTKRGRPDLYYGRIQDLGREQTFWSGRYRLKGGGLSEPVFRKTPAMAGKRFVTGRHTEARREARQKIHAVVSRVLGRN